MTEQFSIDQFRRAQGLPVAHPPIKPGVSKVSAAKAAKRSSVKPAKPRTIKEPTSLERKFLLCISGLPQPEREYRFHPVRRWRFDFVWADRKLAVEVQGGAYTNGGHNRAGHQASDCEKLNEAQLLGWRVLQFNTEQLKHPQIVRETVERAMQ